MEGWSATYYRGSSSIGCNVSTFVSRAAMSRPDVLEFAARYEGSRWSGDVVVMDYNGAILRTWSRAAAWGAAFVARGFYALNAAPADVAPASPAPTVRRRADFRDSGLYEICDAADTVVALLFRDPHDRQWYEDTLPGQPQTHFSERWRGSAKSEAVACIVRRRSNK